MSHLEDAVRFIKSENLPPSPGYSQAVDIRRGRIIYVAGQVALDRSGKVVDEIVGLRGASDIEDAIKNMTYISFEACRLANAYVLHLLNEGLDIPSLDYNNFMRLPFQVVTWTSDGLHTPKQTSNTLLNQVRDQIYAPCRPQGMEWMDGT